MPGKIPNQWSLDRAYYLTEGNAEKTKTLLSIVYSIETNKKSADEAFENSEFTKDRYEQSTQTLLTSLGLISQAYKLTEVGKAYMSGKISFKDMLLIQLIKKEFKYNEDSDIIRPLFVFLNVLIKLKEYSSDECWIDCYDYFKYLINIRNRAGIDSAVADILKERVNGRTSRYETYQDFEVWMYALQTAGLIKECGETSSPQLEKKYTLDPNEEELIHELINNENKLQFINEYDHRAQNRSEILENRFGCLSGGFFDVLPEIRLSQGFNINETIIIDKKQFLENYLYTDLSHQKIDYKLVVSKEQYDTRGDIAMLVVRSLGFDSAEYKGKLKPYINRKNLLSLSEKYRELGEVYDLMFNNLQSKEQKMKKTVDEVLDIENRKHLGYNRIYYGAPGCGKSHHVAKLMKNDDGTEKNYVRVTFHPEYTNYDFVGQILPIITGPNKIEYKFTPGPFTEALVKAYSCPDQGVYLIIEEINRGNAAAIFGDLFQLLDRDNVQFKDDDMDKPNGNFKASEYSITNPNLSAYLKERLEIDENEEFKISIPSNMIVLATMNSSDQGVFTLDTAFKRRWDFEQIPNEFTEEDTYRNWYVPGTNVKWQNFVVAINEKIVTDKGIFQINEDKRIGKYFVSHDCLTDKQEKMSDVKEKAKKFAFKVFEYLWNDVCKIEKTTWFSTENINTLEKLIDEFTSFDFEPNSTEHFALENLNVNFIRESND